MPLFLKPHTATLQPVSATTSGDEITGYTRSGSGTVAGQMTEKNPQAVLEEYGIDLNFPAVWLCNIGSGIKVGDRLVVNTRNYTVVSGPQTMDAESVTSHERFLCERHVD